MTIKPLQNSFAPTGSWVKEVTYLKKYLSGDFIFKDDTSNVGTYHLDDVKCEFYYFFGPKKQKVGAYKNAIWVKVNGQNKNDLWLCLIRSNEKTENKKVSIYSAKDLSRKGIKTIQNKTYKMPADFDTDFAFYEEIISSPQEITFFVEEMDYKLTFLRKQGII